MHFQFLNKAFLNFKSKLLGSSLILLILVLSLSSCSHKIKPNLTVTEKYENGLKELDKHKYSKASTLFEEIFYDNPLHQLRPYSEIMQAYALFKNQEYDKAIDVLDVFIKFNSNHPDISYAHYLRILAYVEQMNPSIYTQKHTDSIIKLTKKYLKMFPDTIYTADVKVKARLAEEHLAAKEMNVALYYFDLNNFTAAINRFEKVLVQYGNSVFAPEALYRLIELYTRLGLNKEAQRYLKILGDRFPDSDWHQDGLSLSNKIPH